MYKYDRIVVMSCPPFNFFYSQMNFDCARDLGFTLKLSKYTSLFVKYDPQLYKPEIEFHFFQGHRPENDSYVTRNRLYFLLLKEA